MIPKILITIRGGCLEEVISTEKIEYNLIDYDNISFGDEATPEFYEQDSLMSHEAMLVMIDHINVKYSNNGE